MEGKAGKNADSLQIGGKEVAPKNDACYGKSDAVIS